MIELFLPAVIVAWILGMIFIAFAGGVILLVVLIWKVGGWVFRVPTVRTRR